MKIISQKKQNLDLAQNYMMREVLLKEKQNYFQSILQKLQFQNEDENGFKIIIDQTNQKLDLPNCLDCKFAYNFPNEIDESIRYVVINETIETNSQNIEELQIECQPQYNVSYEFQWEQNIERETQIYKYLLAYIDEEQDILIYCKNLNEIDCLRKKLSELGQVIVKVSQEFDPIYKSLCDLKQQTKHTHQIFLTLEAQYFESESITLIFQTEHREIIRPYHKNSVIYENQLLSKQELIIREIPKCSFLSVRVIYNFPQETYFQMEAKFKPIKSEDLLQNEKQEISKTTAIIKAVLNTSGTLQLLNLDSILSIRTSQLWSFRGDPYSWLDIIEQFGNLINSIFFNLEIDKNQSIFEYLSLEQWCDKNMINFVKALSVLLYIQEYSNKYECPQANILNQHGLMMPPIRRSSSFQASQEEKPQVEEQLINSFNFAELREDRAYHFNDQSFELHQQSIYKYKGRLQKSILILALKNGEILYLHNRMRKQSLVQKEYVINNVSNAVLEELWKNSIDEITQFENQMNCTIEPNSDLNLLTLYFEDKIDVSSLLNKIEQIKSIITSKTMDITHVSGKKLILRNGAEIQDYLLEHESREFILKGLPQDITEKEIYDLFLNFTNIIKIQFQKLEDSTNAKITIEDKTDIPYIIEFYDSSIYRDRFLTVQIDSNLDLKQSNKKSKFILKIVWYAQFCAGDCTVTFVDSVKAQECLIQFDHQFLEGKEIKIQKLDDKCLKFSNLSAQVTQRNIYMICGGKKNVQSIEFNSKSISESKDDYSQKFLHLIQQNVKKNKLNKIDLNHQVKIIKKPGGLRSVKIHVYDIGLIQELLESLNGSRIQLGINKVKIYCKAECYQFHKINLKIKQLVQNQLENYKQLQFKISFDSQSKEELMMTVKSSNVRVHQQLDKFITGVLQGQEIVSQQIDKALKLPFFMNKLMKYENELTDAYFIVDKIKQKLRICCDQERFQEIQNNIQNMNLDVANHSIKIPSDSLKTIIGFKAQGLDGLKKQFNLGQVKYKKQNKELYLEGDQKNLQDAIAYIQNLVSFSTEEHDSNNFDEKSYTCPICFEKIISAYQLQGCGHKCCLECMGLQCQGVLQDIKLFPIRCPICNEKMVLYDIFQLVDKDQKQLVIDMALNKFILENNKKLTYCYTPGCQNFEELDEFSAFECSFCLKSYCTLCKALSHPGFTCEESKIGDLGLLLKLMKEQDIRKCPNCSALIQRTDGCYRVTCTACHKSICWKNDKQNVPCMKIFDSASECYEHLSKEHGGYW